MRKNKAHMIFRLWTAFLSLIFAVLLFPAIISEHGIMMSLIYTGLGVGFIWSLYFAIGRFLEYAVTEELRRRGINPTDQFSQNEYREPSFVIECLGGICHVKT